eukprot:SAG11_NODE_5448_length_1556_cov_2.730954_1_plen_155_part_10
MFALQSLTDIDLSHNDFSDTGVAELAPLIAVRTTTTASTACACIAPPSTVQQPPPADRNDRGWGGPAMDRRRGQGAPALQNVDLRANRISEQGRLALFSHALQPCSPKPSARTESLEKCLLRPISARGRFWLRSLQWVQFLLTCVFCVVAALTSA